MVKLFQTGSGNSSFTSVHYDGNYYYLGALIDSASYDAGVFVYYNNLTQKSYQFIGGTGSDYASSIVFPYMLISTYGTSSLQIYMFP